MNKPTIPFDLIFHNYQVYTNKNNTSLIINWGNAKFSHYIIEQNGEISNQYHQLDLNPMGDKKENYYWQDSIDLAAIQKIYVLVKKYNYEVIVLSLRYLAQYFKLEDTSAEDFSMDHANAMTDALDALKHLFIATEDQLVEIEYKLLDDACQKYFFSSLMSNISIEFTEDDKLSINKQFSSTADFLQKYSN